MIWLPDHDPSRFYDSELDLDRTEFQKNSTGSDMDIQIVFITAAKCLIIGVFQIQTGLDQIFGQVYQIRIGPDYSIKYLD